jgi:hypothetical protein
MEKIFAKDISGTKCHNKKTVYLKKHVAYLNWNFTKKVYRKYTNKYMQKNSILCHHEITD